MPRPHTKFLIVPNPETPSPFLFPPKKFTPRSRPALRSTSRKRTFSNTCCEGATVIALMTGVSFPARVEATSTARVAATASLAWPLSTTWPFALPTLMSRAPVLAMILLCSEAVSGVTSRSTTATRRLFSSKTEMFVVPICFPWT